MKRRAAVAAIAAALALAGCADVSNDPAAPEPVDLAYVRLTDGRLLECLVTVNRTIPAYSCNWGDPIEGERR